MKTKLNTYKTLLVTACIIACCSLSAQTQTKDEATASVQQYCIHCVSDMNGKPEVMDKTFASKEEMETFLKENKLNEPGAKTGKRRAKKNIVIVEKVGSDPTDGSGLTITCSNLSAEQRAMLIQKLLEMKDCKVDMQQIKEISTLNN